MHCPITGINIPRFLLSVIIGFAFIFGFDFFVHGTLLQETYAQTPGLWRGPAEMVEYFPFMLASQFLISLLTSLIFTRNYEGKGLCEGLRFGAMIGILMGVMMASSFAWMPISATLAASWLAAGATMGIGLGLIFSLTYKK